VDSIAIHSLDRMYVFLQLYTKLTRHLEKQNYLSDFNRAKKKRKFKSQIYVIFLNTMELKQKI